MSTVTGLLFVCAGNICRSPMAEALFRHLAKSRPALEMIEVGSAGTVALYGNLPCADSVDVMRQQFGLEIVTHRARPLTKHLDADLVLALDRETEREAQALTLRWRCWATTWVRARRSRIRTDVPLAIISKWRFS